QRPWLSHRRPDSAQAQLLTAASHSTNSLSEIRCYCLSPSAKVCPLLPQGMSRKHEVVLEPPCGPARREHRIEKVLGDDRAPIPVETCRTRTTSRTLPVRRQPLLH